MCHYEDDEEPETILPKGTEDIENPLVVLSSVECEEDLFSDTDSEIIDDENENELDSDLEYVMNAVN